MRPATHASKPNHIPATKMRKSGLPGLARVLLIAWPYQQSSVHVECRAKEKWGAITSLYSRKSDQGRSRQPIDNKLDRIVPSLTLWFANLGATMNE